MIYKITLLTTFIIAVLYPLSFWISFKNPLKEGFHKFHIGLPVVLSGIVSTFIFVNTYTGEIKSWSILWCLTLAVVAFYYWNKECPNPIILSVPVLIGAHAYILLQNYLIGYCAASLFIGFLGGFILVATLFAMNLGHWYLNVHGLPISHLVISTKTLGCFLIVRFIWDAWQLTNGTTLYQGDTILIYHYLFTLDGFLLSLGLLFGTIFPLISLYYVLGTLKVKSTQSATGILYVVLCAVLIGDMTYKYYAIKFSIFL